MTEADERKGRARHILKRSSQVASKTETVEAPVTSAEEPESTAIEESSIEESSSEETVEAPAAETADEPAAEPTRRGGGTVAKVIAFGVVPVLAVVIAVGVGWLTYTDIRESQIGAAREQAMQVAKDSIPKLLSYNPDTVEKQLTDARGLLAGEFKDSYTQLTTDVVIPGAKQQRISAVATVPRAASVSTETDHAVVLVFVNQTVVVGDGPPSATLSSVRVTLDKVDGRWLISTFDPV